MSSIANGDRAQLGEYKAQLEKVEQEITSIEAADTQRSAQGSESEVCDVSQVTNSLYTLKEVLEKLVFFEKHREGRAFPWQMRQLRDIAIMARKGHPQSSTLVGDILADEWKDRLEYLHGDVSDRLIALCTERAEAFEDSQPEHALEALEALKSIFDKGLIRVVTDSPRQEVLRLLVDLKCRFIGSVKDCLDVLELADELEDHSLKANLWRDMAHRREENGDLHGALTAYRDCLDCSGKLEESRWVVKQYGRDLQNVYRIGTDMEGLASSTEIQIYKLAIIQYYSWKSSAGLDLISSLAEQRSLVDIRDEANQYKLELESILKEQ